MLSRAAEPDSSRPLTTNCWHRRLSASGQRPPTVRRSRARSPAIRARIHATDPYPCHCGRRPLFALVARSASGRACEVTLPIARRPKLPARRDISSFQFVLSAHRACWLIVSPASGALRRPHHFVGPLPSRPPSRPDAGKRPFLVPRWHRLYRHLGSEWIAARVAKAPQETMGSSHQPATASARHGRGFDFLERFVGSRASNAQAAHRCAADRPRRMSLRITSALLRRRFGASGWDSAFPPGSRLSRHRSPPSAEAYRPTCRKLCGGLAEFFSAVGGAGDAA